MQEQTHNKCEEVCPVLLMASLLVAIAEGEAAALHDRSLHSDEGPVGSESNGLPCAMLCNTFDL